MIHSNQMHTLNVQSEKMRITKTTMKKINVHAMKMEFIIIGYSFDMWVFRLFYLELFMLFCSESKTIDHTLELRRYWYARVRDASKPNRVETTMKKKLERKQANKKRNKMEKKEMNLKLNVSGAMRSKSKALWLCGFSLSLLSDWHIDWVAIRAIDGKCSRLFSSFFLFSFSWLILLLQFGQTRTT